MLKTELETEHGLANNIHIGSELACQIHKFTRCDSMASRLCNLKIFISLSIVLCSHLLIKPGRRLSYFPLSIYRHAGHRRSLKHRGCLTRQTMVSTPHQMLTTLSSYPETKKNKMGIYYRIIMLIGYAVMILRLAGEFPVQDKRLMPW
jgi:hypothetical protein